MSDREAGLCTMSQLTGQPKEPITNDAQINDSNYTKKEVKYLAVCSKRHGLFEGGNIKGPLSSGPIMTNPICKNKSTENMVIDVGCRHRIGIRGSKGLVGPSGLGPSREVPKSVPDVASAIKDLLEQTSKPPFTNLLTYF